MIDRNLVAALKVARGGKAMQFAFFPKGAGGLLMVDKQIPPKTVADKKKVVGSSTVFKGRVIGSGGTLIFEVAKEPPATLLGQLKQRVKNDAGMSMPIEIRVKGDAEAENPEGDTEESPENGGETAPEQSGDGDDDAMAEVRDRLNALAGPAKAAMKGPLAARIPPLLAAATGAVRSGDAEQAAMLLDQLEPLLADEGVPTPPPSPEDSGKAAVMKRFNALSGAIKDGLKGGQAARIGALAQAVSGLIKNNNTDQAGAVLDELEEILGVSPEDVENTSSVPPPPPPPPPPPGGKGGVPPPPPPPPPQGGKAAVMKRLNALTGSLKAALQGPEGGRVQSLFQNANRLLKEGDIPGVEGFLSQLESLLGSLQPGQKDASDTIPPREQPLGLSKVKLGKARLAWMKARSKALADLDTFIAALEKLYADDTEQQTQLASAVDRLEHLFDDLDETLQDDLDALKGATDPENMKYLQKRTLATLNQAMTFVMAEPLLAEMDGNEVLPAISIKAPLMARLQELKDLLA